MESHFSTVVAAVETIARGGVVIVLDALDRENEGDFIAAAELMTPETVHFMITHGRGHLCQAITLSTAERIDVQPLVVSHGFEAPRFAMPVDFRGCTTGISPVDRALTIASIVDPSNRADDFVRPGHIFPLIAQEGGVLHRQGHTEAAIDLTTMAGLTPSGVLCEICSRDGRHMADLAELKMLGDEFSLPIVTIDDLVEYRRDHAADPQMVDLTRTLLEDFVPAVSAHRSDPKIPSCISH